MKIIAFIHPEKFFWLLGEPLAKQINYCSYARDEQGERIIFLAEGKNLLYLSKKDIQVYKFDSKKCEESNIVVVPDKLELTYQPTSEFKIIFHTETPKSTLDALRKNKNYRGEIFNQEDKIYNGKISKYQLIVDLVNKGFDKEKFQTIYSDVPEFNYELELKLELLHSCLESTGAGEALKGDISFLSEKEIAIVKFLAKHSDNLSKPYIEQLTELRKALLGS